MGHMNKVIPQVSSLMTQAVSEADMALAGATEMKLCHIPTIQHCM